MKVCLRRNWLEPNFNIKEYQTKPTFCGTETEGRTQYPIKQQKTAFLCLEQDTVYSVSMFQPTFTQSSGGTLQCQQNTE